MIRRPLNKQFNEAVIAGRKITTIRESAWPVGVPIMFYNWSSQPYRSKQVNVAEIVCIGTQPIWIERQGDHVEFRINGEALPPALPSLMHFGSLWCLEGFESPEHMQEWFRAKMRPGTKIKRMLNGFQLNSLPSMEADALSRSTFS